MVLLFFCSSRRRHTRCALVTGVQTCALPISGWSAIAAAARADIGRDRHHVAMVIDEVAHLPDHAQAKPLHPVGLFVAEAFALERAAEAFLLPFRSEEHTSELQSLMRISYAVFCLKKKNKIANTDYNINVTNNKRQEDEP